MRHAFARILDSASFPCNLTICHTGRSDAREDLAAQLVAEEGWWCEAQHEAGDVTMVLSVV